MAPNYRKKITTRDLPDCLGEDTVKTIARIEAHPTVVGIMFIRQNSVHICTVPEAMAQTMITKLPQLSSAIHRAITEITVTINKVNPIIDRIMEDESVEGVIMTNKEGAPILTNISTTRATNYGLVLQSFGTMAQIYVKELDTLDEVLVARIHTKKSEIMMAPHPEFTIIVIQHARHILEENKENKPKSNRN